MVLRICCSITLLALCSSVAWGQIPSAPSSPKNTLAIWVKLVGEGQLPGLARVELFRGDMPLEEVYCDSRGRYTFYGLADASYAIRVSLPGFRSQYEETRLNGGARRQMIIHLRMGSNAEVEDPPLDADPVVSARWLAAPEKARQEVTKARQLRRSGDLKGAVKRLRQALKMAPNFVIAHNELGLCQWRLQKLDAAQESFETAIGLDADFLPPWLNLAEVFSQKKEFNQAGGILLQASRAHPQRGEPYYAMAKIQFHTGHLERAEQACRLALERKHSKVPEVHILLANIFLRRGELAQMASELEAYLAIAPKGEQAGSARATLEKIKRELEKNSTPPPRP